MLYVTDFIKTAWMRRWLAKQIWLCFASGALLFSSTIAAQTDTLPTASLKKLSLEELMDIEVTSVSKTGQSLSEVASAIQVITGEDIRRSGAWRLAGALRLAPNLHVAQVSASDYAISSRGFNGAFIGSNTGSATFSNKLLVLIDGRAVYNPLFGGVYWDVQNVILEDIDRIEVISGPGGTLWGANAVNGVINVMSKSSRETQGLYATGAAGSFLQDHAAVRYGGQVGEKLFFRVHGQFFDMRSTTTADTANNDRWQMMQGGFRMDYYPTEKDILTVQGDLYNGSQGRPNTALINGQYLLARWSHTFSEKSDLSVQAYFDRTFRQFTISGFSDELETYDFDFQHRFKLGKRQTIVWGGGYRFMKDEINRGNINFFFDPVEYLHLATGFVQDQINLVPDKLELTIGTKLLSNYYSGFEYQPSARLAYTPNKRHTLWSAVSRAIRGPSRFDEELTINKSQVSENVLAYELGYRVQPMKKMSVSIATFFNDYTDVRNINKRPPAAQQDIFGNKQTVRSWGVEFSANYWVADWWRLRTGYTYFDKEFTNDTILVTSTSAALEGSDPKHQFMLQSIMDIKGFQIDLVTRVVSSLPATTFTSNTEVPTYGSLDVRVAYVFKRFEFSVVGQDILAKRHQEFRVNEIPWSIYGRITVRI